MRKNGYNLRMRILILSLILFQSLFAFELVFNVGRNPNSPFGVLHLSDDNNFSCKELISDGQNHFECLILGSVHSELENRNFNFFNLEFIRHENTTQINILPKTPAKMFDLSQKIYEDTILTNPNLEQNSSNYTFLFSAEIPYLTPSNGLNFETEFDDANLPFVGALDLDSNPVIIPQSADINTFLRIKDEYEKENYTQVITDATNAIARYQGSIFMNEFELYRLRAKNKLYTYTPDFRNQDELETLLNEAKAWSRTYTSDRNFTEVLYITLRAYMALEQKANVDYTISSLANEHPNDYYAQLGLLDYADYINNLGEKQQAELIYNDIYYKSKDPDIAARAAIALARLAFLDKNKNSAFNLIDTVFKANPQAFAQNQALSLNLANLLYEDKDYALGAEIYEQIFNTLAKNDPLYESVLRNLALAISKTPRYTDAKRYLDLYSDEFENNSEYMSLINEAKDNVFFNLPENNATLLHARYKELMQEYANEIAAKALEYDVKLYEREGNLDAVLAYKTDIEKYDNAELKNILASAALRRLNGAISADDCIHATNIYEDFKAYDIGSKANDKKALLACFIRTLKVTQAREFIDNNKAGDPIYYELEEAKLDLNAKNYAKAINLANGVLNSRIMKSEDEKFNAYYVKFLAQLRNDDYNDAIKSLRSLEGFEMNYQMVEALYEFLLYCNDRNLTTNILTYAPKAIDFQNLKGVNVYSPELEFIYLGTLEKTARFEEALAVLKDLLKIRLNATDRARALFVQSDIYEKMQNQALQSASLRACLEVNATSNWQDLCRQKASVLGIQ